jgi:predicted phosphodiesterase
LKDSDLIKAVESCNGKIQWARIAAEFGEDSEKLRSRYRVISGKSHKARTEKQILSKFPNKEITDAQMLSALKVKRTPQQDADILHMPITEFVRKSDKLLSDGYNIREANNLIWLETAPMAEENELREDYNGETEIAFGLISDTHMCNKNQQLTYLNRFYDECKRKNIKTVYHAGDISDGYYKNRPEHIYELLKIGADEQADYIIDNYPKCDGLVTKFISGNHDSTHIKNGGCDIGRRIADKRPDMEYLGYMSAKVWLTPQCDMDLFHPLDGATYALSYSSQKFVDGLQGGQKPRILAIGHHHKALYYLYRNIHVFEVPCFEAQTAFEKGKKISVNVGGWIVRITCKPDGTITSLSPMLIPYYDMMEHDY